MCCSVPSSFLQPRHFLSSDHPNVSFLHPSSFHDQFSHHIEVLVYPQFVGLPSQHSLDWLQPDSFFRLLTLVFDCPFLPMDHPGPFQKHLLCIPAGRPLSCPPPPVPLTRGVALWPLAAKITGFARNGPRKSCHLSPRLCFKGVLPPRLLLLPSPSAHPYAFRPKERGHGGYLLLDL